MIYIPNHLPQIEDIQIDKPNQSSGLARLLDLRASFYSKLVASALRAPMSSKHLQSSKFYLYETYNLMILLTEPDQSQWQGVQKTASFRYRSSFNDCSLEFSAAAPDLQSTAEIIFSRYAYTMGVLKSMQSTIDDIDHSLGNWEALASRIGGVAEAVEDVAVRIAKIYSFRDYLWAPIDKAEKMEKDRFKNFPEFDYHFLESFYL